MPLDGKRFYVKIYQMHSPVLENKITLLAGFEKTAEPERTPRKRRELFFFIESLIY